MRRDCGVEEVTVNKPNPQAVGLYRHMGVYRRIDCGEEGTPYPLLYRGAPELKTVHDPGGHWPPGSCYGKEGDEEIYRCTRPEPSPPASFSTSETVTRLKSPSMECFRAEAATANSIALWLSLPLSRA